MTPRLTLNRVRYDIDFNLMDQENHYRNATREVLEAIGIPTAASRRRRPGHLAAGRLRLRPVGRWRQSGARRLRPLRSAQHRRSCRRHYLPGTPTVECPRDAGEHRHRRGPAGHLSLWHRSGSATAHRCRDSLPRDSAGQWLDPNIRDPKTHQAHIGYAHTLAANTVVSVDYTHVEGRNEMRQINLNPIVNGRRVLADDFVRVFGVANVLSNVNVRADQQVPIRRADDALSAAVPAGHAAGALHARRRVFAWGSTGNRSGAGLAQDQFDLRGRRVGAERTRRAAPRRGHRRIRPPVRHPALAGFPGRECRPHNLTAGSDLNADGTNNDRWIDPATGKQVSLNTARGDPTSLLDLRTTKFIDLGGERTVGVFVEVFNVFNTVNFGGYKQRRNGRSSPSSRPVHPRHRLPASGPARRPVPALKAEDHRGADGSASIETNRLAVTPRYGNQIRIPVFHRLKNGFGGAPEIVVRRVVMGRHEYARVVGAHILHGVLRLQGIEIGIGHGHNRQIDASHTLDRRTLESVMSPALSRNSILNRYERNHIGNRAFPS